MTRSQALAAAAIVQAAADRTGTKHWHDIAQALTEWAANQPAPKEEP